jgi:hypothetical protein
MSMEISNDTIGNGTRDLLACSTVLNPLRHRMPRLIVEGNLHMESLL